MTRALVLLVGENPLPVWVSWSYLAANTQPPFDRIVLVSSRPSPTHSGTQAIAERIASQMKGELMGQGLWPPRHVVLGDPGDGREIVQRVGAAVADCDFVHLNHTGGTKPMAVHSYEAVRHAGDPDEREVETSYLDPRHCNLRGPDRWLTPHDLRDVVRLSFHQLGELHDIAVESNGLTEPLWPVTAAQFLEHGGLKRPWETVLKWSRPLGDEDKENTRRKGRVSAQSIAVDWPSWAPGLGTTFADESGFRQLEDRLDLRRGIRPEQAATVQKFFAGGWLESVMLDAVGNAAQERGIRDLDARMQVLYRRPGSQQMELDVVVLRGYQLTIFSCSRALSRPYLKNHGFEVAHRAAQLGGEEARAVLVTLLNPFPTPKDDGKNVRDLEADLDTDLKGAHSVTVLGRRDLTDPVGCVKDILFGAS